ncbi:Copia protein [Durusdinium trenchii]|uniref:Copia protein n=1 Tax=Durusdinium trenchii TaxID=1381693 RepID=A0ABP0NCC5_9DINO
MSIYMSIGIYLGEDFGAEKSNRGVATGVAANDWWRDVHRWCPPSTGGSRAGAHGAGRAADVSAAAAHADPPPNNGLVGVPQASHRPELLSPVALLLEAALPLATHPDTARIVGPLLMTLHDLSLQITGDEEALGALLAVLGGAFATPNVALEPPLRAATLDLGMRLMMATGPQSSFEVDVEGGLLGRCFDAWESLASWVDVKTDRNCCGFQAFEKLLQGMPQALQLPEHDGRGRGTWNAQLRPRTAQLLTVWCAVPEAWSRPGQAEQCLGELLKKRTTFVSLEFALSFAAAVAEALAASMDGVGLAANHERIAFTPASLMEALEVGYKVASFWELPQMQDATASSALLQPLEAAVAELIVSMDPWIDVQRYRPESNSFEMLVTCVFQLCRSPHATPAAAEALSVVVSNLAPNLAPMAEGCFGKLKELILGDNQLSSTSREQVAKAALGPLLSELSETVQVRALHSILEPLRVHAPPCEPTPQRISCWRLLFAILAAPTPERPEASLEWLSEHWAWFEVSLMTGDSACEAATTFLETALTRTRGMPACASALLSRALPALANAAILKGSSPALQAVAQLARIFKGGDEHTAPMLALHVLQIAEQLLGKLSKTQDLPPDLFAALLELFVVSLAPRAVRLAPALLGAAVTQAALEQAAQLLEEAVNPKLSCWALLFIGRLPLWLPKEETQQSVRRLLEQTLPKICLAFQRLLAQPVAKDTEVMSTLAEVLISLRKALGLDFDRSLQPFPVAVELLPMLQDPLLTEEVLAASLLDLAEQLQAEELRGLMGAQKLQRPRPIDCFLVAQTACFCGTRATVGPALRSRGLALEAANTTTAKGDADIQDFYAKLLTGGGGEPVKGTVLSELIVKFFHGEFLPEGFRRYSGQWKGPPPGTIGRKDIEVALMGLQEQMAKPHRVTKGGVGYGVDETQKVEDDGKGWIWLAAEMTLGRD